MDFEQNISQEIKASQLKCCPSTSTIFTDDGEKKNEISSFYFCGADVAWRAWMLAPIWLDIMTTDRWRE